MPDNGMAQCNLCVRRTFIKLVKIKGSTKGGMVQ